MTLSFNSKSGLLELLRSEAMPNGNLSIRGVARLAGVNDKSIISGADFKSLKLAEFIAPYGFEGADLAENGFPPQIVILVLEYFAYISKAKSKQAQALIRTFGTILLLEALEEVKAPIAPVVPAAPALPQDYLEALKALVASEEAKRLLQIQNEQLEEENNLLAEAIDELFDYSSIVRVAKFNGCSEKSFSWRPLKAASVALAKEIKQVPCPRFVTKNLYSHDAWRYCYPDVKLPETTTLVIKAD